MSDSACRRIGRAIVVGLLLASPASAQPGRADARAPIIDMHLHARTAAAYGATGLPLCAPMRVLNQRSQFACVVATGVW